MNAESETFRASLAKQLSSIDDQLADQADDVDLLADIQNGIGRLLEAGGGNEADIRRMLQERYEAGHLRKETFQLVKSMLDRYVTEEIPTSPPVAPIAETPPRKRSLDEVPAAPPDQGFRTTAVLEDAATPASSAEDRVQVGSLLRDRFLLQERVAGGSMGVVYKALDRRLAEAGTEPPFVAVKVLSPKLAQNAHALRALQQEAAKGRCLTHQNIVRFIDLDRDDDLYFMVMEWLEGDTLANILDAPATKRMDVDDALKIVRKVGRALAYAHRCGIVHADVKPGNVMVQPDGTVKIFDFGVARVRQKSAEAGDEFDPGVLGAMTPAYSSMQVLTGEDPAPADDVFSLACLLYRLIAGYRVFGPRNAAEAAEEGMKPQRAAGLSDEQWRALKKALAYARVARFDSMEEFLAQLEPGSGAPVISDATPTIDVEPMLREAVEHVEFDDESSSVRRLSGLIVLLFVSAFAGYQYGVVDKIRAFVEDQQAPIVELQPVADDLDEIAGIEVAKEQPVDASVGESIEVIDESEMAEIEVAAYGEAPVAERPIPEEGEIFVEEFDEGFIEEAIEEASIPVVDFNQLPPPDRMIDLPLVDPDAPVRMVLREGGPDLVVDLVRGGNIDEPLFLKLEEVGHSGNRSPWATLQYTISNDGLVEFPQGQARGRVSITMSPDPLREADQQSTLIVRMADSSGSELATIELTLEDDDQRRFESELPANTIAFAASQVSVGERDPAVQIDVLRFNPNYESISIDYVIRDITASEGLDYFAPGSYTVSFGPGQRSARILIPLVQDAEYEGDEAFSVELVGPGTLSNEGVHFRIAVMIRDDDPPTR